MKFEASIERFGEIMKGEMSFTKRATLLIGENRTFSKGVYAILLVSTKKQSYDIHPHPDYFQPQSNIRERRPHITSAADLQFKGLHLC